MLIKSKYELIGAIASISKANPAVYVHVHAPGWAMFEGINPGTRLVQAVDAAAGTITIAADTTAQVDTTISPEAQVNMAN